jgi:hypothetical protein
MVNGNAGGGGKAVSIESELIDSHISEICDLTPVFPSVPAQARRLSPPSVHTSLDGITPNQISTGISPPCDWEFAKH